MRIFVSFLIKFYNHIPTSIRGYFSRTMIDLSFDQEKFKSVSFKVAETEDELLQAYSLVQKEYQRNKIVDHSTSGARITRYNLLPTSIIFIAKDADMVFGTVSLLIDSKFGLPCDAIADLTGFREEGFRIAEISALAVDPIWRKKGSAFFFALVVYCTKYAHDNAGVDFVVASLNRKLKFFYEDIFLFKKLKRKKNDYHFVNDKRALPLILNIQHLYKTFFDTYKKQPKKKNLYLALIDPLWGKNISQVSLRNKIAIRNNLNLDILRKLLRLNNEILLNLSLDDRKILENYYGAKIKLPILDQKRSSIRVLTNMKSLLWNETECEQTTCLEISANGMCIRSQRSVNVGDHLHVNVMFNDFHESDCDVRVVWKKGKLIGCEIQTNLSSWQENYQTSFLEYIGQSAAA